LIGAGSLGGLKARLLLSLLLGVGLLGQELSEAFKRIVTLSSDPSASIRAPLC
jgi:hypothetical protein